MAGATRSTYRKPPVRSVPPSSQRSVAGSSQSERQASCGTTIADEPLDVANGGHAYVTPQKTEYSPSRTDISRLSQDFEPLHLNTENGERSAPTVGGEAELLGEHVKAAFSAISRLEGLGLQRLQIPLPNCVCLGEQSTGKSSVIEAISGIKTPRSTDTCTRCPLFIKMESSNDSDVWKAEVVLRKIYKWDGKNRSKFPGWVPDPSPTDVPFASTTSPHDLENLIARAQAATLSPLNDPEEFMHPAALARDPDSYHRCQFSPNVVCIHVSSPEMPSLSFYDLPGVIGQSESASNHFLVKFVKDLVSEYIKNPDSLILVTCSLENDIANSTAGGIAREMKATERCIGVLTKPDRLPPGSRDDKLQAVLDGKRFALGHGYFVVKNLGQDAIDQGLGHREARVQEQQFFALNEPWSTTFQAFQSQFGTASLQTYLSRKLTSQMLKMLPVIHQQVVARLQMVEADLKQLPEPPTQNATRVVSDLVFAFSESVRKEMEAEYPHRDWRNTWECLHKGFLKGLLSMKPTMSTSGQLDEGVFSVGALGKSPEAAFVIDSDDEDDGDTQMADQPVTPQKKRKVSDEAASTPARGTTPMKAPASRFQTPSQAPSQTMDIKPNIPPAEYAHLRKVFRLDEVARHLKETSKSKVPNQLQPKVIDDLIIATIEHWHKPMDRFFDHLQRDLKKQIQSSFHRHFIQWQGSALYHDAWAIVEEMLNTHFTEQRTTMAAESLNDEREGPYIFNEDVFSQEIANTREQYRQARYRARLRTYVKESQSQTGRPFTSADEEKLKKDEKKCAFLRVEPYELELAVVAQVTSYYMIAARRFYEAVCMRVESKFFKRLRTTLRDDLDNGLGIHGDKDGPQNAIRLLAEPSHRLQQRQQLENMRRALLQGLECLQELQEKYQDAPSSSQQSVNGAPVNGFGYSSFGPTSTPLTEDMEDITRSGLVRH